MFVFEQFNIKLKKKVCFKTFTGNDKEKYDTK